MKYVIGFVLGAVVLYNFPELGANIDPMGWFVDSGLRDQTVEVLEGVTDKASAESAKSKIEALTERMNKLEEASKALGEPSAEKQKELQEKYGEELDKIAGEFFAAIFSTAANKEVNKVLKDVKFD